nr:DUF397 domain-containing protein [Stackebrandtia nassauensis]
MSTRTGSSGGNCVEVGARAGSVVAVRDTKNRSGGALAVSAADWAAWVSDIKDGSFDS